MQQIIISGIVSTVSEQLVRSDGAKYILFYVSCLNSNQQTDRYAHYRCASRVTDLKAGDQVFLVGTLKTGIHKDKNGEPFVDLYVRVDYLNIGRRA